MQWRRNVGHDIKCGKIEDLKNKCGKELNDTLEDTKRSKHGKEKASDAISDIAMC